MRLICPNCEAQYAVGDDLIPPGGRDVQCSNCGRTWFQYPEGDADPDASARAAGDVADPLPDDAAPPEPEDRRADDPSAPASSRIKVSRGVRAPKPAPVPAPDPAPQATEADADAPDWDADDEAEDAAPVPPVTAPRRRLDASLLQVLREEAEREQAARRREAGGLEMQPDLGVAEPERVRATPPVAPAPEPEPDTGPADQAPPVPRPDAVPDPVRPVAEDAPAASDTPEQQSPARTPAPVAPSQAEAAITAGSAAAMARGDRPDPEPAPVKPAPVTVEEDAAPMPDKRGPRRDLLPDIEEINSTLRASGQTTTKETQDPRVARAARQRRQKGFRLGFGLALIAAGLALFVYSRAPMIVGWLPQAEAPLVAYVNAVNDGRVWLDDRLRQMVGPE